MSAALTALDANGNTLTDASGRSFTWDCENRLTQVVNPGVGTTTFRRVAQVSWTYIVLTRFPFGRAARERVLSFDGEIHGQTTVLVFPGR